MNIFTTEIFIFAIFVQKNDFEQSQFKEMDVALPEFSFFSCFYCGREGKVVLKVQMFCRTNIFTIQSDQSNDERS